jgi:hypothetical protein
MAKFFNGACSKPGCPQEGEVVETWGDSIDSETKAVIGSECEACRSRLTYVLAPFSILGGSKSDQIYYYNTPADMPLPPLGSIVVTDDPSVTNQEGPFKIGTVVSVKKEGLKN